VKLRMQLTADFITIQGNVETQQRSVVRQSCSLPRNALMAGRLDIFLPKGPLVIPFVPWCSDFKRNSTNSIRSNPNEVPTSDPKEISNILNKYFATIGSKLASKIPQTINTFFDYLDPPLNRTFFFDPIIQEDINLEISILQDNKAHGLYSSPVRLLKLAKSNQLLVQIIPD